jgi:2-dehydro-3-deoxygluconokinase
MDIIGLGEAMVEFNQINSGNNYLAGFGGDTSNCIVAAARQGAVAGYISSVGSDTFGDLLLGMWEDEGVDVGTVQRNAHASTGIYFITHSDDGHKFTYYRKGSAASLMSPAKIPRDAIKSAKILHTSAISQAISESACDAVFAAVKIGKEAGVTISYDTNLRLSLWPLDRATAIIQRTAALSDIMLPSYGDAQALTGLKSPDDICDHYLGLGVSTVAMTMGEQGAMIATPDKRKHLAPHKINCLDATGAGDTFDGAFLARIVAGDDVFESGQYANAAAALSTTGFGATEPIPRPDAIRALMSSKLY